MKTAIIVSKDFPQGSCDMEKVLPAIKQSCGEDIQFLPLEAWVRMEWEGIRGIPGKFECIIFDEKAIFLSQYPGRVGYAMVDYYSRLALDAGLFVRRVEMR